jgi:hypothetical protein
VAFLLGLHRQETHDLPDGAPAADVVLAEEALRTFWTLYLDECAARPALVRALTRCR